MATATRDDEDVRRDGRRVRSERSRDAVVDALLDLLRAGVVQPSAQEIADGAGVSLRTVFRHFDDLETLLTVAVEHQTERIAHHFEPLDGSGALPERIAALAAQRQALFEEIGPVRRAAVRQAATSPTIAANLTAAARRLRRQVAGLFALELRAASDDSDPLLLEALTAAASWECWDAMRIHQRLSATRARQVLDRTLHALLKETP